MRRRSVSVAFLALVLFHSSFGQDAAVGVRGWLEYKDGNRLSGSLMTDENGEEVFASDLFGSVPYDPERALFVSDQERGELASPSALGESEAEGAESEIGEEAMPARERSWWSPSLFYVSGSVFYKDGPEHYEHEWVIEAGADWKSEFNTIQLKTILDYKRENGATTEDDLTLRFRWFRDFQSKWFVMAETYSEQDHTDYLPFDFDYNLYKVGGGGGLRFPWKGDDHTRIAVMYSYADVQLKDYDIGVNEKAVSLFFSNELSLTKSLDLVQWCEIYFWEDDSKVGIRNEIELSYRLTEHFSVGVKDYYIDSGDTLREKFTNELYLFTKYTF